MQFHAMTAGRTVKPEQLSRKVNHNMGADRTDDWAMVHTDPTVSELMRALIEQLAPGDVQYELFEVFGQRDRAFQQKRYWFITTVRLRAINKDKTRPPLAEMGHHGLSTLWEYKQIFLDASITQGRIVFASNEYPGVIFVSDAHAEAVEASGLTRAEVMWKFRCIPRVLTHRVSYPVDSEGSEGAC